MSQRVKATTPAPGGGGSQGPASRPYFNNLFGPDGQPVNAELRRVLTGTGPATLGLFRFTDGAETFYALGCWVNRLFARAPAMRHTGYTTRLIAHYSTVERRELLLLLTQLLPVAPPCLPARPLGEALCFLDPWPVLNRLPAGARRLGPCVVQGAGSPHRPESPQVRGLRRRLAAAELQLLQVQALKPTTLARVGLPLGLRPLWVTLPVGAHLLEIARRQLVRQVAALRKQLKTLNLI